MKPVKLMDVIDYLETVDDQFKGYYCKNTGEIITVSAEDLGIAEESEEDDDFGRYPEWQQEEIKESIDIIVNWEDYIELPDKYEFNEHNIMEEYSLSIKNDRISDEIYNALKGKGAFRRFKDKVHGHGLSNEWYSFKSNALRDIAIDWCKDNNIEYVE